MFPVVIPVRKVVVVNVEYVHTWTITERIQGIKGEKSKAESTAEEWYVGNVVYITESNVDQKSNVVLVLYHTPFNANLVRDCPNDDTWRRPVNNKLNLA